MKNIVNQYIKRGISLMLVGMLMVCVTGCGNEKKEHKEDKDEEAVATVKDKEDIKDTEESNTNSELQDNVQNTVAPEDDSKLQMDTDTSGTTSENDSEDRNEPVTMTTANVGDVVTFGNYNGNTEWIVLNKKHGKVLLLSKYLVDYRAFNEKSHEGNENSWENSTLREWMNTSYLNQAFNEEEQKVILDTEVTNTFKVGNDIAADNITVDKAFLLSTDEVLNYFESNVERRATFSNGTKAPWWLRSPGCDSMYACGVCSSGEYSGSGDIVSYDDYAVRPAMWIDITEYMDATNASDKTDDKITEALSFANAGNIVAFGNYNGNKEWIVLDKENDKILLMSKNIIDARPYNEEGKDISWENCTLREWLNTFYYNTAFDIDEQSLVLDTKVINKDNETYGTSGGNDTIDKVYLLSLDEANKYLGDRKVSKATFADEHSFWWWLRSPGKTEREALVVGYDGDIPGMSNVNRSTGGIRPVLWVDISKK